MRITLAVFVAVFAVGASFFGGLVLGPPLFADETQADRSSSGEFFMRLDADGDGRVTLAEAPERGKMLVEFLMRQAGKEHSDYLDRSDFDRLMRRDAAVAPQTKAISAALAVGDVRSAPENCPAGAMGLTAELVFNRLDVNDPLSMKERLESGNLLKSPQDKRSGSSIDAERQPESVTEKGND